MSILKVDSITKVGLVVFSISNKTAQGRKLVLEKEYTNS